jgi:hypothetical protein
MTKIFAQTLTLLLLFSVPATIQAESNSPDSKISPASSVSLTVDPDAVELAITVVEKTLPNLIGADPVLAKQLGFSPEDFQSFRESGATVQSPLPIFVVSIRDIVEYVKHPTSNPVELIKKEVNWVEGQEGTLIPARWLFPVDLKMDAGRESVIPRSSVIIGKSLVSPWRVHQIGGPNLVRAIKKHATTNTVSLIWVPGINRHYLGQVYDGVVKLKVLFNDPLAKVQAGYEFDPSDPNVINRLRQLEADLQLQERLRTPVEDNPPIQKQLQPPTPR